MVFKRLRLIQTSRVRQITTFGVQAKSFLNVYYECDCIDFVDNGFDVHTTFFVGFHPRLTALGSSFKCTRRASST